jgi:hypothetical protein
MLYSWVFQLLRLGHFPCRFLYVYQGVTSKNGGTSKDVELKWRIVQKSDVRADTTGNRKCKVGEYPKMTLFPGWWIHEDISARSLVGWIIPNWWWLKENSMALFPVSEWVFDWKHMETSPNLHWVNLGLLFIWLIFAGDKRMRSGTFREGNQDQPPSMLVWWDYDISSCDNPTNIGIDPM